MTDDNLCKGCNSHIIDGQTVVLSTVVVSVMHKQLGDTDMYHKQCYPEAAKITPDPERGPRP